MMAANASGWLDDAFARVDAQDLPRSAAMALKDSAQAYYDLPDISTSDKAFAAYVLANVYAERSIDDRASALQWAQRAVTLAPSSRAYQALVSSLSGGRP